MLYVLVQIIFALIIIILMGVLAYGIYNKNAQEVLLDLVKPKTVKIETPIIKGAFAYGKGNKGSFNTTNKGKGNYVNLSPSINQKGGAVYTYNFWLYIPDKATPSDQLNNTKTLVLFNRGSNQLIKYKSDYRCDTTTNPWFLVKNPLVRLDFTASSQVSAIIVEFNSIEHPDVFHSGANTGDKECTGDMITRDANLIGIKELERRTDLTNKWNMVTIMVSETSDENNVFVSSNQAVVKLYLNGYAYLNKDGELENKSTAMKVNNSELHLGGSDSLADATSGNPILSNLSGKSANIAISDLTYFNYTLTDKEVVNLFKKGCNKNTALIPSEQTFANLKSTDATLEITGRTVPVPI